MLLDTHALLWALASCASLPDVPKPQSVAEVADLFDDALAVAEKVQTSADAALPLLCSLPDQADECQAVTSVLARSRPAIDTARVKVAQFRKSEASVMEAAKAVRVALREVRALAE